MRCMACAIALRLLCDGLIDPTRDTAAALALLARMLIGPGQPAEQIAAADDLPPAARSMAQACALGAWSEQGGLRVLALGPKAAAPPKVADPRAYRFLIKTAEVTNSQAPIATQKEIWRGVLRLLSMLQPMPGLHAAYPGLDDLPAPEVLDEEAADWRDACEFLDPDVCIVLRELQRRSAACPPDLTGCDLMDGDRIVGQIDFGWSMAKVGVSATPEPIPGWVVLPLERALEEDSLMRLVEASRRHAHGE